MKMKIVLTILCILNVFVIPGRSAPLIKNPGGLRGAKAGLSAGAAGPVSAAGPTSAAGPAAAAGPGGAVSVMDHGAKGDGKTEDTKAFEAAWQAVCSATGTPTLTIPKGSYLTGPVKFGGPCKGATSITVQLDGTLLAATSLDLYKTPEWFLFSLIDGLVLIGTGTFDGQGTSAWPQNKCPSGQKCNVLPTSIKFHAVKQAKVQGISSINPKFFHMGILESTGVEVSGVKITAPEDSPNTDGIHIERCTGVTVKDSTIGTGDDCISVGHGNKDITLTGINCGPGHGLSVGSLGKYKGELDVSSVLVKNCTLTKTMFGARIKTWEESPGPSCATNITYEDITMVDVGNPIIVDQTYCPFASCAGKAPSKVLLKDITFRNVHGTSSTPEAVTIDCSQAVPCSNVIVENVNLEHSALKPAVCTNAQPKFTQTTKPAPCAAA